MYSTNIQEASTAPSKTAEVFSGEVDATLQRRSKVLMEHVHVSAKNGMVGSSKQTRNSLSTPADPFICRKLTYPPEFSYPHG